MKFQQGISGIDLLFLYHRHYMGWVNATPGRFTSGTDPVPIVQEVEEATRPVWTGKENVPPPGFDPQTVQPITSRYTDCAN
jgi:hypothetical protein